MKSTPPSENQVEISLFGSGFGEAIAVHLPGGKWLLIDSCIAPRDASQTPVSGQYLADLGVDPSTVISLVASHWHADHTRGLGKLAAMFGDAEIMYPNFMRKKEGLEFLAAFSGRGMSPARGTGELYQLFKSTPQRMVPVGARSEVIAPYSYANLQISGVAMSPMPAAFAAAASWIHSQLSPVGTQVRHAAMPSPNFASIAISLSVCGDTILLGSDLEEHHAYGWTAVAQLPRWKNASKASLYKVAHHGSQTGDSAAKWADLLEPQPISILTPFAFGRVSLPTVQDIQRIKGRSRSLHTSSGASLNATLPQTQLKLLRGVATRVTAAQRKLGHVRYRKRVGEPNWQVETFDAAQAL